MKNVEKCRKELCKLQKGGDDTFWNKMFLCKSLWIMWKSHAFQQVFRGFEQGGKTGIFHFSTKKEYQIGDRVLVTETKNGQLFLLFLLKKLVKISYLSHAKRSAQKAPENFCSKLPKGFLYHPSANGNTGRKSIREDLPCRGK